MSKNFSIIFFIAFLLTKPLIAAEDVPLPPSVEGNQPMSAGTPPDLGDDGSDSRNIPQPEVRIIQKKDVTIEEYRVNGRIRYAKITPSSGKPYYMVDTDGDGKLDRRENNLDNPPINKWILLEW